MPERLSTPVIMYTIHCLRYVSISNCVDQNVSKNNVVTVIIKFDYKSGISDSEQN